MALQIFNTLTKQKEEFTPINPTRVRMFVCGPTVYDYSHIGHARTYISFDVIAKILRRSGLPLEYVINITDIDDKIIARANERGEDWKELAKKNEEAYLEDMESLGIDSISKYARASEFMPAIIEQIKALEEKGYAYQTSSGVYFRVPKFEGYGKLSRRNLDEMREGTRVETDKEKEHPSDFVLWKAAKPGEPTWESPWGEGRPGWHIEDTAITYSIFGPQYDLHGGALDLIFPHHESEIAQNEAAYDVEPFVKVWMHTGFLNTRGEKMAKSLGNFITIRKMLETTSAEAFRLFILSAHYRSPINFDEELLNQAKTSLERIINFKDRLEDVGGSSLQKEVRTPNIQDRIKEAQEKFDAALLDDFDTPGALAVLFELIRDINPLIEEEKLTEIERDRVLGFLREINGVFGIIPAKQMSAPPELVEMAEKREEMRREKNFDEADKLRNQIAEAGWELEDTPKGPRLIKKS